MSGSEPYRLIAPLALLLLPALGCGTSEQGSTLPSDSREANPATQMAVAQAAVTPAGLAALVESRARALASREYTPPETSLPRTPAHVDYGRYRSIRR